MENEHKDHKDKTKHHSYKTTYRILTISIIIIALLAFSVIGVEVIKIPCLEEEEYTERIAEPYQEEVCKEECKMVPREVEREACSTVIDTITEEVPVVEEVDYDYTILSWYVDYRERGIIHRTTYRDLKLVLKNNEGLGGEFKIIYEVIFDDGGTETWESPPKFISSGQTETFIRTYTNRGLNINNATYTVIAPKKDQLGTEQRIREIPRNQCVKHINIIREQQCENECEWVDRIRYNDIKKTRQVINKKTFLDCKFGE